MSLISQTDRQMVIEALEFYVLSLKTYPNHDENKLTQLNTLLNWIKLEHFKHEN
jgi:hypothetical protein